MHDFPVFYGDVRAVLAGIAEAVERAASVKGECVVVNTFPLGSRNQPYRPFAVIIAIRILWIDSFNGYNAAKQRLQSSPRDALEQRVFCDEVLFGTLAADGGKAFPRNSHHRATECTSKQKKPPGVAPKIELSTQRISISFVVFTARTEHISDQSNFRPGWWEAEFLHNELQSIGGLRQIQAIARKGVCDPEVAAFEGRVHHLDEPSGQG